VKIATFNVNGVVKRWAPLEQWLTREQPDVACLQELKAPQQDFPAAALKELGYDALWQGQQSWNGVAILSRIGAIIESRRGLPGDPSDKQSRYIEAAVNGVIIACLYAPNGNPQPGPKFEYKLAWMRRLQHHVAMLAKLPHPVVLAGDFNVVPTDDDIYSPASWKKDALLQPESRRAYFDLLEQGWTDTLRMRHPHDRIYTFWSYFRNRWPRNAGLRIDHLLTNATAARRIQDDGVDSWVRGLPEASDHAPAWIVLGDGRVRASAKKKARRSVSTRKKPAGKNAR
jgi:exodeoxyribonuclease-3